MQDHMLSHFGAPSWCLIIMYKLVKQFHKFGEVMSVDQLYY